MIETEAGTTAWFAMQYGRGKFAIFGAFESDEPRQMHLRGDAARGLETRAEELLVDLPRIDFIDLLGAKLSSGSAAPSKALLLTFHAQIGHTDEVAGYLCDSERVVDTEPNTMAWFGFHCRDFRVGGGEFGIFDVFADNAGRFAHLTGRVPRGIAKQGMNLFRDFPEIRLVNLLESKLPH
ncbi:MAG: hypothetical protein ABIT36_02635 [Steroidobacteraceae bacterium]